MSPENVAPEEHPIGRMVSNYRLEALVGVGGMGQVYRAWDERLGRTVAVKALRDYLSQDNVARQRFVREARLASRIVHPYVATVFDVVEEDRDVYLVMEYVEGRSLKRVLSRRTLSVQETSRYGREIAEALNTIHAAGLVHRDLKPANVMITNENHIKVMDFGVAREYRPADPDDSSETSITRSGHIAGTPAYMSPEQLRGKKVDNRSDLFSLGIILYESVTGQHPFMRDTYAESLAAIINESPGGASEPESLSQSTPIRAAVLRLLEKDPAKRFQSAEELIPLLDLAGSVDQARPARVPIQQRSWFIPIALGLIVSIAGILYWSFRSDSVPSAPLHSRQLVAVLPIEDHTHAGDTAFSGEMLAALLAVDLGESKIARSLGHDRVVEIVSGIPRGSPRNAQIAAIRRFADVDWVVAASVFSQDTAYEAAVDVYRAGSSSPHASFRVGAARASGLIDLASVRVLKAIDPRSTVEQDAPEPSSRDDEALALEYAARRAVNEYRFSEAIDLLERALSIDPQFIAAQVRLAAALELAGYGERARSAADRGLRMIDDPLRKVSPRLELEGRAVRASLYNDLKAEVELRRELAEMYPDEPGVLATLAAALAQDAQLDEALAFIERALAIEEDDPWLYNLRASVLQRLERYQEAIDSANRAARLFGEMNSAGGIARSIEQRGRAKWGLGDFAGAAGDFAEAAASFERAGLEVPAARAKNKHGDIALAKGELGAARAIYEGTLPVFRRAGNFSQVVEALSGMGTNYLGTGEPQEAESFLREAVEVADELDNPAILIKPLANLASLLVYTGRIGEGRNLVERTIEIARVQEDRYIETAMLPLLSDIDYQRGRLSEAEISLRDLIAILETPGSNTDLLISSLIRMAAAHEGLGNLGEALAAMDRAVELATSNPSLQTRAYTLWSRADILSRVADRPRAEADLRAAEATADETGAEILDLAGRIRIARAMLALADADWVAARRHADDALIIAGKVKEENFSAEALMLAAEASLREGDAVKAKAFAERALESPGIPAVIRTRARVMLARTLAATGNNDDAAESARQAFEEARSMKEKLSIAMSATVLVSLPRSSQPVDVEVVRASGRTALEGFLGALPEGALQAVISRADVREAIDALSVDVETFVS